MEASIAPETQEQNEFALVMGPTQIASISIVLITVIGTFCSIAYVAGRSVSGAASAVVHAAGPPMNKPEPPRAAIAQPSPAPAPVASIVMPTPAAVIVNVPYYQVLSVQPGIARVLAEGLALRGFHTAVSPGASAAVGRVLVGPIDGTTGEKVRQDLESLGFHPFLRRFSAQELSAGK